MLRSPAATPFTVSSSARASSGSGASSRAAAALAREERDLEVGDRVEIGVADGEGLPQHRVGAQQFLVAGDPQDFADREGVFGLDGGEDVLQLVGHEGVDVVPGDAQIGLGECHLHVGQEVLEEVPVLVHLVQDRVETRFAQRLEPGADPVPAGHDLPGLGPAEDPRDGAQPVESGAGVRAPGGA